MGGRLMELGLVLSQGHRLRRTGDSGTRVCRTTQIGPQLWSLPALKPQPSRRRLQGMKPHEHHMLDIQTNDYLALLARRV